MPSKLNDLLANIRAYVSAGISTDMSAEQLQKANDCLKTIDEAEMESKSTQDELTSCKEFIVKSVREDGSKTPPTDDAKGNGTSKTLEEIAQEVIGK